MAKHTIKSDRSTQLKIKTDGDTWTLNAGTDVVVYGKPAIAIAAGADNNTINILGNVLTTGTGEPSLSLKGDHNTINLAAGAAVEGLNGIYGGGTNTAINNNGDVNALMYGVYSQGAAHVSNHGEITGMMAVLVGDNDFDPNKKTAAGAEFQNLIVNHQDGKIIGGEAAVIFGGVGDQKLVNDGLISGSNNALNVMGAGTLHIVNRGSIDGNLTLGVGADIVDTRAGIIHGKVEGGEGNDTYLIGKAPLAIVEDANGGDDTVKTTTTHTLADNVERLVMLGKEGISATGNAGNNIITGNSGNNVISGLDGADMLEGGKGNDNLSGGTGIDTFLFHKGDGKDVITDFENGMDHISLFDLPGATSFSGLTSHISEHGNDVWLTFGADRLILTGMQKADIDATDFLF